VERPAVRATDRGEICAATAIDPEAAIVDSPGAAADAGRAAHLIDEFHVAGIPDVAPVPLAVVGGAADGCLPRTLALILPRAARGIISATTADGELGAAAAINPEAAVVDAPGVAADAGGAADLADEFRIAGIPDVAPVPVAVVGGAADGSL